MTLLAIVAALVLEQLRPLSERRALYAPLNRYARFLESQFNDGEHRHGAVAWIVLVSVPVVGLFVLHWWLVAAYPALALVLDVAVLYVTAGFRQFSHFFTDIHLALRMGELDRARHLLAEWRGRSGERLSSAEVARLAIEEALVASHRHVFAPLCWFVVLGPAGAMLYRLSLFLSRHWEPGADPEHGAFGEFARQAFRVLDFVPLRLTAAAFAIVGDFEDAVFCWRGQAHRWPEEGSGILLASGGGALGVRLGMPIPGEGEPDDRPELGLGDEADADFMQSTIGLLWRSLVLGLLLLALLWVASWVS